MTAYRYGKSSDRRRGPDIWLKTISWLGVTGWLIMVAAMMVADKAKPPFETVATRFFNVRLRSTWDKELSMWLFCLMCLGLCMSSVGLAINSRRLSRKDDQLRINLIIIWLICKHYIT